MDNFEMLRQAVDKGIGVQTITLIAAPEEHQKQLGQMVLVFPQEGIEGCIIDAGFTQRVVEESKKQGGSAPCILNFSYEQFDYQVFWNVVGNEQYRAIILGGGHISQPLVQILAILEYDITVVDDRLEFANPVRFPGAQQVLCDNFANVLQEITPDEQTAVIIVTRGHKYDLDCLRSVIGTQAGYIGMIGSRRKVKATLQVLAEEGISQELLNRVRAPIGLDLGGQSPGEIGVSVAAEVVATFKGGSYLPLSSLRKAENHG
jgi:xanthine dehydrogenase accessory factor